MLDILQVLNEETEDVTKSKTNTLIEEYELFRTKPGEIVAFM